ncbi:hypothetical protein [Flavobacterium sp. HJJ]|uniref:hypothetical protein n=1 Tax=Flavobacterium sp. HJJ TaxID=2783792 RepID=UPI00188D7700|nr:hypothetical protein [Flavobacterium sp. HJJ]MBF4471778.1 hypothetical protein [Flavobacterium sp. HJJ]
MFLLQRNIAIMMLSSSFNPAGKSKADTIQEILCFRQKTMSKEALLDIITKIFPPICVHTVLKKFTVKPQNP